MLDLPPGQSRRGVYDLPYSLALQAATMIMSAGQDILLTADPCQLTSCPADLTCLTGCDVTVCMHAHVSELAASVLHAASHHRRGCHRCVELTFALAGCPQAHNPVQQRLSTSFTHVVNSEAMMRQEWSKVLSGNT